MVKHKNMLDAALTMDGTYGAVYVNGVKHKNMLDAALTMDGTYAGLRKALDCGLLYKGFIVSYEPPPPMTVEKEVHYPGAMPLLRNPQVTP